MRKIALILIFLGIGTFAGAQKNILERPFSTKISKASIAEFLNEIDRVSGIIIQYSTSSFDEKKIISLLGTENTIGSMLQTVLDGQHLKLIEQNNKIILVPSNKPLSIADYLPAQYSFYGYVKESATREPLVNASIYEPSTQRGMVSNNEGYFNFHLSRGKHIVVISYGSFQPVTLELNINGNLRHDILLRLNKTPLPVVIVESAALTNDGSVRISDNQISYGGYLNEDDPLQFLYLSPGLQTAANSFSDLSVRGGGSDENLFLLDGNRVYNPTHLLGAVSILNPTVIKAMKMYKSDFPAKYSGSLSSVLDVYTRQGNMKQWQGEVNAGLLTGSITLEGPLVKNKVAIMISGRKNIPLPFYEALQDGVKTGFYDAHFRLTAIVSPKNRMALNIYTGEDQIKHHGKYVDNRAKWGNRIASLAWHFLPGSKTQVLTTVNYNEYNNLGNYQYALFENDVEAEEADIETDDEIEDTATTEDLSIERKYIANFSSIKTYSLRSQAEIYFSRKVKVNTGFKLSQTIIKPFESRISIDLDLDESSFNSFKKLPFEDYSVYAEPEIKLTKKFFIKPGLHANLYRITGFNTIVWQPRLYLSYSFLPGHKIFASYSKLNQFLHLVTNPYAGVNRDLWVPSTKILKPEVSEIYNFGYSFQQSRKWQFSIEGYYKQLKNVTNFAEGKSTFINDTTWEQNIELGKGRSYGSELAFKKKGKKLSLLALYTLSWSWRQFNSINNGKEFPFKHDHRHTANIGITYSPSERFDITGLWSYSTGDIYFGSGVVFTDTLVQTPDIDPINDYQFLYQFGENGQHRAESYQRYDLSVIYHSLKKRKTQFSVKAGVYNINGADGQYSYNVRGVLNSKSIRIKTASSTFSLIPYLSVNLKF
ncbi:MAG: carboxypeptidase-like regulatory domain-containing protein [Bacteroidetes bacterium]|nr:carboxypeptidase-like regulatory domain-containing protein [Bacteroidota bacterium]